MRIGGYYIELGLDASDFLSMVLLTILWFVGIFAFRTSLVFLELLPRLADLPGDFQLSARLEILTWQPFLTSIVLAAVLGPVTHWSLTRAAAIRVYRELAETADAVEHTEPHGSVDPDGPPNGEI